MMDSITLKCPITIKAKVTEELKSRLAAEIQDAIKKADMELQQIEFHAKRLMAEQAKQDAQGLVALRQQIDAERQKRIEFKNHMLERLKETAQLEIGAEIVQGSMERIVTVSVGDDLHKIMGTEILLEDGKIIAFRS
ncbi:YlqD family protein [Petrimonas sp.]|uniref:YlqD family protein n=1 Tax=Petrimonas sp. TaxID=2023866 RepID=UPI003F5130A6